ncbi:hypothetical protein ACC745_38820, partial [Rhizobium ruizarguesonis]
VGAERGGGDENRQYHSPLNVAGRFSLNDATPSFRSPVFAARIEPRASTAVPLSSPFADAIINNEIPAYNIPSGILFDINREA